MVIADDFQQREGPPAMPRSLGIVKWRIILRMLNYSATLLSTPSQWHYYARQENLQVGGNIKLMVEFKQAL